MILTQVGAIESALIKRLDRAEIPYVTIVAHVDAALKLHDEGYRVMVGELDDPEASSPPGRAGRTGRGHGG